MKKLGFGFMRLPLKNPENATTINMEELIKMVDTFIEHGFTYFDTAYMYHDCKSQQALREALVKRHPRDRFTIATKMPTMPMFLKVEEDMERIFQEQLEACGVDYFDYYLLHNMGEINYALAQKLHSFEFIKQKKKEGKIRKIGFSFHDSPELLEKILTEQNEVDFVQMQLNYLDWDDHTIQSGACLATAQKHGKPVVVMEPIKGGTLTHLPAEAEALLKAQQPNMSLASWAIRYAAAIPNVMMVLSGMSNLAQMADNVSYMENFTALSREDYAVLDQTIKIINNSITVPCTACQYCVKGCPKQIPIPKYFALYNTEKQVLKAREAAKAKDAYFSLQGVYYDNIATTSARASDCIECKQCEQSCPQHIKITEVLKDVVATFEK